jgi:hypothetical protein
MSLSTAVAATAFVSSGCWHCTSPACTQADRWLSAVTFSAKVLQTPLLHPAFVSWMCMLQDSLTPGFGPSWSAGVPIELSDRVLCSVLRVGMYLHIC